MMPWVMHTSKAELQLGTRLSLGLRSSADCRLSERCELWLCGIRGTGNWFEVQKEADLGCLQCVHQPGILTTGCLLVESEDVLVVPRVSEPLWPPARAQCVSCLLAG